MKTEAVGRTKDCERFWCFLGLGLPRGFSLEALRVVLAVQVVGGKGELVRLAVTLGELGGLGVGSAYCKAAKFGQT